ncbi:MAG: hypothetical protein VKK98_01625 [Cyanobacteriota bacterium]|nr:hypothetical protein [Cyanobacteriota bacterium]
MTVGLPDLSTAGLALQATAIPRDHRHPREGILVLSPEETL